MNPGDLLVIYTDGFTETHRHSDAEGELEEYGVERMIEVARDHQGRKASEVIAALFRGVNEWSGGSEDSAEDDRTAIVVSYPAPSIPESRAGLGPEQGRLAFEGGSRRRWPAPGSAAAAENRGRPPDAGASRPSPSSTKRISTRRRRGGAAGRARAAPG